MVELLLAVLGMVYLTAKRDHERMILDCRGGSRAMRRGNGNAGQRPQPRSDFHERCGVVV